MARWLAMWWMASAISPAWAVEVGGQVWAIDAVAARRFPDGDVAGPSFAKDARLVVLVVESDRLRVMGPDNSFGWVPTSAVTEAEPMDPRMLEMLKQAGIDPSAPPLAPPPAAGP
jgi:hypothetical protein